MHRFKSAISAIFQFCQNLGFMQEKVQREDFLKKDSRELIFCCCCFRFLWIYQSPGTLNWERVFFWLSKNLYSQCGLYNHKEHHTQYTPGKEVVMIEQALEFVWIWKKLICLSRLCLNGGERKEEGRRKKFQSLEVQAQAHRT